jgi:hypothetical protein
MNDKFDKLAKRLAQSVVRQRHLAPARHNVRAVAGVLLALFALAGAACASTPLLIEDFDYTVGTYLTNTAGWAVHSDFGANPLTITSPSLTYAGYEGGAGVGNAVDMTNTGEDDHASFTSQTSGSLYAAFLVQVTAAQTNGDYFFHFYQSSSAFFGKVFVKKDPSSTSFAFGTSKNSDTATYTGYNYSLNTTYLLVVKYTFNSGTTTDDTASLFINPAPGAAEPGAPDVGPVTDAGTDSTGIIGVALTQGTAANAPSQRVDGLRVATTWADAVPATLSVQCPPTTNVPCMNAPAPFTTSADFIAGGGTISGGCAPYTVNSWDNLDIPCPTPLRLRRIYTITDSCGNTATCQHTINEYSAGGIVISNLPANDITLPCNSQPSCSDVLALGITVTDPCFGTHYGGFCIPGAVFPGVGCQVSQSFQLEWLLPCSTEIRLGVNYTWTVDTNAPVFTKCPQDINLGVNPTSIPDCDTNASNVAATDDCLGTPTIYCARTDTTNGCTATRTLIYSAVDACNNTNTCTQVITWTIASTPPVLTAVHQGNNVVISWPETCATFFLEQTSSPNSPVAWTRVSTPPIVGGGLNTVTLPLMGIAFFKLCADPTCP